MASLHDHIAYAHKLMGLVGLTEVKCQDIMSLYEEYVGLGYSINTPEELGVFT